MAARPIDIARKLGVSTTTLRNYEELGLIPPVPRSASGYRMFAEEHIAYFICIREMLAGFSLTRISKMLKEVLAKKITSALWMANESQANLHQEKIITEKMLQLFHKKHSKISTNPALLTINDVSRETGVPITTIRYWDKVGLISAGRSTENNYRIFTEEHIRQVLTIHALKASVYYNRLHYSVDRVKEELKEFDYNDKNKIITITNDIKQHLDKVNRAQISGIAAFYRLCTQVEANQFDNQI
ncbi:MerR family DNA-binding transcriptional regulator [Paenibacillus eucommiae]|uniref:DNA-binding transcriptional MerR regulator n=1 Tax=Paenibacillus eucommiae TaxID=1355755 RepID=A0ABS4IVA2_9BACL|nr:MerR family transcriptional regulator [Paenibacillus eucommiae]MBP1991504.1 DNA-binding transcriptional MerR regulator [Paenibacillus eucommiae]